MQLLGWQHIVSMLLGKVLRVKTTLYQSGISMLCYVQAVIFVFLFLGFFLVCFNFHLGGRWEALVALSGNGTLSELMMSE